jgi:NADPH2:quinone reductase
MKSLICHQVGRIEDLVIEDRPDPIPAKGEVVIDIKAAGVNFPDGLMVRGQYQIKPTPPFTPGNEVAGIIAAIGDGVSDLRLGDRVAALCGIGGFAEKIAVSASTVFKIPDAMSFDVASGIILAYGTAFHALVDKARLKPGETVLVLGAAGGVGLAAVEIATALGCKVIAAASSDEKLALAQKHGATIGINYTTTELKVELKRLFPGGVDVVYDPVGGALTEAAVRGLAWGGRLLVIGFANGEIPKLPLNLLLLKEAEAIGVFWGSFAQRFAEHHTRNTMQLMQWYTEGKIRPHVCGHYPLSESITAIHQIMNRQAQGKVVIVNN